MGIPVEKEGARARFIAAWAPAMSVESRPVSTGAKYFSRATAAVSTVS
jgi:hypothetical protein